MMSAMTNTQFWFTLIASSTILVSISKCSAVPPVRRHIGKWTAPPQRCPSSMVTDGPLLGNGDMGCAVGGVSNVGSTVNQSYYVGKQDFWTQQNVESRVYFSHVAPGHVDLSFTQLEDATDGAPNATPQPCAGSLQNGYCHLNNSIPCHSGPECVICNTACPAGSDCDALARAACDNDTKCVAFGVYQHSLTYELYFTMPAIPVPLPDVGWAYWYKYPFVPQPVPSFSATQELWIGRVNTSVAYTVGNESDHENGARGYTVNTSAVMHPDVNILTVNVTVSAPTTMTMTLASPNQYGLPIQAAIVSAASETFPHGGPVSAVNDTLLLHRQNNKWVHNDAVLMECSALVLNVAATRVFQYDPTSSTLGALVNGSDTSMCMWVGDDAAEPQQHQQHGAPSNTSGPFIAMAPCGTVGTKWMYHVGNKTVQSTEIADTCVGYYIGAAPLRALEQRVMPVSCSATSADNAQWNIAWGLQPLPYNQSHNEHGGVAQMHQRHRRSRSALHAGHSTRLGNLVQLVALYGNVSSNNFDWGANISEAPCLAIVRPNINISLTMAAQCRIGDTGAVLPVDSEHSSVVNGHGDPRCLYPQGTTKSATGCTDEYAATTAYTLQAGTTYVLHVAIETLRTSTVAYAREYSRGPPSPLAYAAVPGGDVAHVLDDLALSAGAVAHANAAGWEQWWAASAVDLGPERSLLEGFWYGAQYMLRAFAKSGPGSGGVIPGLLGPWSMQDPVGWSDDVTLDYNAEANFYGAASSNHAGTMWAYFPTLTALIPLGQQRASLPTWSKGGHESHTTQGQQTEAMGCACDNYDHCVTDIHGQTCPPDFGGFDGIEIPSAIGGFAELHCSHDSAMRSTAAMGAQPFIDYYDHTHDRDFLRAWAYPFVREVARFYASYVRFDNATQAYEVPHACAQELCGQRQGGGHSPPQRSATIDLSYARWIFAKAAAWSSLLEVDVTERATWESIAPRLASYPVTTHPDCAASFPWGVPDNCSGWSEATNTDTNTPALIYANYMWPISNFAPIHPTGQVSLSSDQATLALARRTVWMLNNHSAWRPTNGLCLAWPSAARLTDKHDPYPFPPGVLLEHFEAALNSTMQPNFWPSMSGGGLEQVGATQALNELLLQSFEGFLRFFPGWPLGESASFTALRTVGAHLVNASVDATGAVHDVAITSTAGAPVLLLNPFARASPLTVVDIGTGRTVAVNAVTVPHNGSVLWTFNTTTGSSYSVA
eukprot:m.729241 g.729241  ORF g.729241 m.729241 type:complete len:1225 (+) comp23048_c0_seq4:158-3832(+)